jgi:hypothetical protein
MEDQASSRSKSGIFEAKLETGDYDRGTVLEIMVKAMDGYAQPWVIYGGGPRVQAKLHLGISVCM